MTGRLLRGLSFRARLLGAMMLVLIVLTVVAVYLVQRNAAAEAERDLQQEFRNELASLSRSEDLRQQTLAERCRRLALNPRIHAALEDNALDLLYPSAKDELRDIMQVGTATEPAPASLHATFYRFLDANGAVIPPPISDEVGYLTPTEEKQISLAKLPDTQQIGYLFRQSPEAGQVEEVTALPIFSTDTGEVISTLVFGFEPFHLESQGAGAGMRSGIFASDRLYLPSLNASAAADLSKELANKIAASSRNNFATSLDGEPHLVFFRVLNAGSVFPPSYQVCLYPLGHNLARQRQLQGRIIGGAVALLAAGFLASHLASARLSRPVEKLAIESRENLLERRRAEASLATTSQELQRSTRFSADASHQLKSPVAVLRAGIESLLERPEFDPTIYDELGSLLHQTYRLTAVIDDLLLLSRMDAGRLQLNFTSVNLSELVEEWVDDLSALPDEVEVKIEKQITPGLLVAGEKRYTSLIVQNLLENARKYNRPGGRIRVAAWARDDSAVLTVGNTGSTIPPDAQPHIFERFHRGGGAETVAGHGLGLNLARDLTRLHGGELRLVSSANDWTEFELAFRLSMAGTNGSHSR